MSRGINMELSKQGYKKFKAMINKPATKRQKEVFKEAMEMFNKDPITSYKSNLISEVRKMKKPKDIPSGDDYADAHYSGLEIGFNEAIDEVISLLERD